MKVVFVQNVENNKAGDVKEVADGYARNFLLPRGLARAATPEALKQLETQREAEAKRAARALADAQALAEQISGITLTIGAKVGANKRLHGSVTGQEIAAELKKQHNITLDRHDVELGEPIKRLGDFQVPVKIGHGLEPKLKVTVTEAE
ncbi:MAG TPA: 50S ribosomal protein L9 [Chloroflexota bacterium]|nr:50S ribosomal protein L9 [Chloroflexota bacterium]